MNFKVFVMHKIATACQFFVVAAIASKGFMVYLEFVQRMHGFCENERGHYLSADFMAYFNHVSTINHKIQKYYVKDLCFSISLQQRSYRNS